MTDYIFPVLIVLIIIAALYKKVNVYNCFAFGAKQSLDNVKNIFPFLLAIFLFLELFKMSGLSAILENALNPVFSFLGIPKEMTEFVLLRPFSGSGSMAMLNKLYEQHGTDSFVGRSASVLMGSTETLFYISAVYFARTKVKKIGGVIAIGLFCCLLSSVLACLLIRLM